MIQPIRPVSHAAPFQQSSRNRLLGIDSIRFVASLWVMLSHYGIPAVTSAGESGISKLFESFMRVVFNGPVAVIVFFVISGLCIHYPQSQGEPLDHHVYFLRRYVRIGIPMVAAILVGHLIPNGSMALESILWSLYCEVIYYTLYPILLLMSRKWGWWPLICATGASAIGVMAIHPSANYLWEFGVGLTWIVGLPCWLIGCLIAEPTEQVPTPSHSEIWAWRLGFLVLSILQMIVLYHTHYGHAWTVFIFCIGAKFWLVREIAFYRDHPTNRWLEAAGGWSYSLYLCHRLYEMTSPGREHDVTHGFINWITLLAGGLLFSYTFYVVVERPSHLLARAIRRKPVPVKAYA